MAMDYTARNGHMEIVNFLHEKRTKDTLTIMWSGWLKMVPSIPASSYMQNLLKVTP